LSTIQVEQTKDLGAMKIAIIGVGIRNALSQFKGLNEALHHYEQQRVARTTKVISLSPQIGRPVKFWARLLATTRNIVLLSTH